MRLCLYTRDSPSSSSSPAPSPFPVADSFFPAKVSYRGLRALPRREERRGRWMFSMREQRKNGVKCTRAWSTGALRQYQSRPLHAERILETQAVISSTTKRLTESERPLTALRLRGSFAPFLLLPISPLPTPSPRFSFLFVPLGNVTRRHAALSSLSPCRGQNRHFPVNCEQLSEAKSRNIMKLITPRD